MPTKEAQRVRCAIYTRKSTEEGLDQAFNSLDVQREACEAYIKSQTHETWEAVQGKLQHNAVGRHRNDNASTQSLLTGLLFDEDGERFVPTYATKSGRRYRCYISPP